MFTTGAKKIMIRTCVGIAILALPLMTHAASIIPQDCLGGQLANECGLDDFVLLFVNLYTVGLRYISGVALLFIVIGGVVLLSSGGSENRVALGKRILSGSFIGMSIVLLGFLFVQYLETDILKVTDQNIIITPSARCLPEQEGSWCNIQIEGRTVAQGVCQDNICQPITQCEYFSQTDIRYSGYGCHQQTDCVSDLIENACAPSSETLKCCSVTATPSSN